MQKLNKFIGVNKNKNNVEITLYLNLKNIQIIKKCQEIL